MFEIGALLERYTQRTTDQMHQSWEQARWAAFINAKVAGAKLHKATDLITFPWEESDITPTKSRKLSPEELAKLTAEMTESYKNYTKGRVEEWRPE